MFYAERSKSPRRSRDKFNEQIEKWRVSLVEKQTLGKSDIDELETHLREEIEQLTVAKLSEEEAFWIATHRLGDTTALAGEFEKVNTSVICSTRIYWMAAGVLTYLLLSFFAAAAWRGFLLLGRVIGFTGYSGVIVSVLSTSLIISVTVILFYTAFRQNIYGSVFGTLANSMKGKVFIGISLLVTVIGLFTVKTLSLVAMARMVNHSEFAMITMIPAIISNLVVPILFPLILVVLLFKLRNSKQTEAQV
jgi:hypothetical protein